MAIRALDEDQLSQEPVSRTLVVFVLLAVTSLLLSYLGAYALSGALVASDLIQPWPIDRDPRPRWMIQGFGALLVTLLVLFTFFRWLSHRQLQRIDAMADEE